MDKHDTLLIGCGTSQDRQILRGVLQERYHLLEANNPQQLLLLLRQNLSCIAALVLVAEGLKESDEALLQQPEHRDLMQKVPIITIIKENMGELEHRAFSLGAADVIPLDYEPYAMLRRIETIVELHLHKQYLEAMVREQSALLRHTNETMVDALSSIIEYRSVESGQHILRIRHFTKILLEEVARSCPEYDLDENVIAVISSASALHDIGKIAIPDSILMKPGRLTREEMEVMKTHAITGCHILNTLSDMGDEDYLRYAHNICHYHHERWDGKGYPEGLAGEEIPICAQVVGLADVYDALTTKRVYKDAYSFAQAVNMILKGECGIFSPKLLECFKHVTNQFEDLARSYADGLSPKSERFDTRLPAPSQHQEENSLERVRAKYTALVHYINALLIEVDLNKDLFHLIYNPYPELSWLQEVETFSDIAKLLNERVVNEDGRGEMVNFFREAIPSFMEEDLRRMTHYFHFNSKQRPEGDCFEVTLIRINPIDAQRRTLALLCRRVEKGEYRPAETLVPMLSDSTCVCRNDEGFTLLRLGRQVPMLAGYTMEELQQQFGGQLLELVIPEDREEMRRSIRRQLNQGTAAEVEFRIRKKNGSICWVLDRCLVRMGSDGKEQLDCFFTDISGSKRDYDALNDKLRRYEIILAQTENVLFEWDMETDRMSFSNTWEKIFGFVPTSASVRQALREGSYFHPDDLPLLMDKIAAVEKGSHYEMVEVRIATARGRYLWVRFRATAIRDENQQLKKIAGIILNIDAEKQAARLLQDRAERDALTKLLNKTAGRKQAEEYLAQYPQGVPCALLIIDLDNFKQVNDRHGHLFGDAVLTKAAREIEKLFRSQDIVARIGGDEFLVLMRGISDRELLKNRCQRLLNVFAAAFRSQKSDLNVGCSIGIAMSPEHGTSYYELFNHADQALYRAKAEGKHNFCFYQPELENLAARNYSGTEVNNQIDSDERPGLAEGSIVRHAFQRLYATKNVETAIHEILAMIGQQMNVSRVYVFENSDDDRFCSNTYEWCNEGIAPEKDYLQNISYETDIPGYADNFDEQGIFYSADVETLPKHIYDILAPQEVKSLLQCAIRDNGRFRGYIGFDECVQKRLWTKVQIDTLCYFSEMLAVFLLKRRQQEQAVQQAQELHTILDNQNSWIYIIDPDSRRLKYLNKKSSAQAGADALGKFCYQALMGRTEPCPGCPAERLCRETSAAALIRDRKTGNQILAEATRIQWQGENSCLMTCRKLPDNIR